MMQILRFLYRHKIHIIYAIIILLILELFTLNKPKEIIKTVVETRYEDRTTVKTQTQVINRVIVKKENDGTITTTTENIQDINALEESLLTSQTFSSTHVTSYAPHYTISAYYPVSSLKLPPANSLMVVGGMRLASLPILVNVGTNIKLNQVILGLTLEL